ncbi:MucBP domain-containing protein [Carnobacterium maltaromaticum]|uniref:MucBP domain-containing protein n=1 Tax=Carnobacterium maltaromaticum TaxID=2751 RepID=UPI001D69CD11|nr:MucBP domain-containing protein [Carnobacterium maltaromaticum]MCC4313274.1 hypothetical protein [Carnobacterium maltaromaticum]
MKKKLVFLTLVSIFLIGISITIGFFNPKDNVQAIETKIMKVRIPDANLAQELHEVLGIPEGTDITTTDMERLTELYLKNESITSLEGLEYAINLTYLDSRGLRINDLTPIGNLQKIRTLVIHNTNISSLAPLSGLSALERLYGNNLDLTDLSGLSNLPNLTFLDFSGNTFADTDTIATNQKIKTLYLNRVTLSNYNFLNKMTSLKKLYLGDSNFGASEHYFSNIENLKDLDTLDLNSAKLTTLKGFPDLPRLENLYISVNQIDDYSPLLLLGSLTNLVGTYMEPHKQNGQSFNGCLVLEYPLRNHKSVRILPENISDGGQYNRDTNTITWSNLPEEGTVTFDWELEQTGARLQGKYTLDFSEYYKEEKGRVIAVYEDEDGQKLQPDTIIEGLIGSSYETENLTFDDYKLKEIIGEPTGTIDSGEKVIRYIYTKIKEEKGRVIAVYEDEDGQKLQPDTIIEGLTGSSYETENLTFDDYKLKEIIGEPTGTIDSGEKEIRYIYTKIKESIGIVIVRYIDKDGKELSESEELTGTIGESYRALIKQINGYVLIEKQGNEKGIFSITPKELKFVYEKQTVDSIGDVKIPINTGYSTNLLSQSNTEYRLPETGQKKQKLLLLLGILFLIIAVLVYTIKLTKKRVKSE